ncbi:MAG: FMN-binding protein [Desulfobacterales bacterium]|nr:FMN-binding protein [Desulfobacterales bacterium]
MDPADREGWFQNSFLAQAWLVLLLAIGFGATLAFVQDRLSGVIAANKLNETLAQVPELVWGEKAPAVSADTQSPMGITPQTISVKKGDKTSFYSLYRVARGKALAGWVVKANGQGYADRIEALIGLDPQGATITGLFILEQKETPGLGNKISSAGWRGQFTGKSTRTPLEVKKGGTTAPNAINAITGATISSRSVTDMVNRTVGDLRDRLASETLQPTETVPDKTGRNQ